MYRGSSELSRGRGRSLGGRGGGFVRGRNCNSLPPLTNQHSSSMGRMSSSGSDSSASLRQRNTTSVKAAASSSRTVEETLRIVPGEIPPDFGMTIRLAPDLMEEIKRVEAQGGTAKIKFDALPNSSTGNIIDVGGKEFKFTWCREPGNLCDIYEEHQSCEDGSGVLVEAGCAWRKLNVQRTLDESTLSHFKMLSVEAEQRTKSRKLIVLDPATASPSLKKQLARAEAPLRVSNKQKKEPPPKKRKVDPAPVVIGGPKPSFRPGASTTSVKNRLSASLGPSPSNQYDTPSSCGTGNIAKTHADNLNVTPVKTRGGESIVASKKDLSTWESNALRNTCGRQETNVSEEFDLHVLLADLLKEAPMSFKALAKAVGDRTPDEAKLIESILKKIANFQAPSNFLKPGADLDIYKNHSTDSKSSPEHQQLLRITDCSTDQNGEGSRDCLHVHLEEKLSAQKNVDVENDLPGSLHEEKRDENRDGQARISNSESDSGNNDSGSGSSSDSEASSVRKEVSDEDVDMMSDGDKEQSAERDAIDLLPSAEIEADLQLLEERLQVERNSIKLFKNMAAYEASQRELLAEDYRRLMLDIGRLQDRVNHRYEYFSGSVSASHKKRKKVSVVEPYDLEHLNASAGQMLNPLKGFQKSSTESLSRHGQMNPGDSSAPRRSHLPTRSLRSVLHHLGSSFESNNQISLATPDVLRYLVTTTETAQVSPGETAEPIQVLTESSLVREPKSDGVSGESRTENVDTISLEKTLMLGDVMEGTDLQDASVCGKYKDLFDGFELLINGSGDLAPESCVNFCEALDVNDYGYDGMPNQAIDLVQSTVEKLGVADEFQVDSREGDEKVSEIIRSKAVSCGVFETNDEEMHDVEISGDDGDNMIIIEDDFPMEMHKETHVSHEVLDKRGEGAASKSSSFEVLSVENGVKENDLTSINEEMVSNKSVPSEEAKARKKEAKARKKRAQERIALGVKKLKLKPPVAPKPKPIISCRHFHRGRCLKGEQCKFSHDTTPETKSLPCCYLATQSCMKGDDCPYDHDLSKYPCNNFVTKGFCHRGDKCLFAHKDTPQAASDRPGANVTTSSSNIAAAPFPPQKPKPIISCRHHLRGRCLEGEQCKFSHDTTPETKSLPCRNFATQSCMKGDDCPYDHDLSKYPCNNFVTNGFCRRGDKCLFSHRGTPQAASDRPGANVTTSSSNTAAASVLPQKSNKQSVRQAIARLQATQPRVSSSTTFLKPSSQSNQKNSSDASSSKINEHATPPQLPPLRKPSVAPKGMSFLSDVTVNRL